MHVRSCRQRWGCRFPHPLACRPRCRCVRLCRCVGGTDPVDVIIDGSFETYALADRTRISGSGTATIDMNNPYDGNRAIHTTPAVTIIIPPGPWSTDPTAWNSIPKAFAGQHWVVSVQVQLGTWMAATIQPVRSEEHTSELQSRSDLV